MQEQISKQPRSSVAASRWAVMWVVLAAILSVATAWIIAHDLIPWLRGPAPYPPEWDWPFVPLDWGKFGAWTHILAYIVYAGLVLIVMHPTLVRWRSERTQRTVALVLAVVYFLGLQLALAYARKGNILELIIFRTYAPPGNGYFMTAVRVDSVWDTLYHYEAAMPNFPHDRPQTHPPGIFLYYAIFNFIFERLPSFSAWFAPIARSWATPDRDRVQLKDPYVTTAFFSGVVQWLTACLAPLGLYVLLRRLDCGEKPGVSTFALWGTMLLPLLASVSSFYSHWDLNYLLISSGAWFFAVRAQDRLHAMESDGARHTVWAWLDWLWAGLLLFLLTWLSFGNAVIAGIVGLQLVWRELFVLPAPGQRVVLGNWLRFIAGGAIVGVAAVGPWVLANSFWNMNYFGILRVGMQMHYKIVNNGRDFNIWRWMNLVDYSLWVGPGVVLLGLVGSVWLVVHWKNGYLESNLAGMALIVWGIMMVLDLSGTARAEIGRLWIFLMPFPVLFALGYLRTYWLRASVVGMLALTGWVMGFALRAV